MIEYFLKSLGIRKSLFGEKHVDFVASFLQIGVAYCQLGDPVEVLGYYLEGLESFEEVFGKNHPETIFFRN